MMVKPMTDNQRLAKEIEASHDLNRETLAIGNMNDKYKSQRDYIHPALNQKPLQRRSTAPSQRLAQGPVSGASPPNRTPISPSNNKSNRQSANLAALTSAPTQRYKRKIGPYVLTKTLGAGSMGKVKLGIHETTGAKVAVKIIPRKNKPVDPKSSSKDEDEALTDMANEDKRVMREVSLLFLLHHPFIVRMEDFMVTPHHYYLMFEFVEGGQLLDYIISHGKLNERTARKFARQILSALDYCNRNSVVHRDLKIENILISNTGSIKIIDFGLSNLYSTKSHLSTFCGSLYFAAPELLSARPYVGPEVDIWSFGIVLYVLMCGEVPFDDKSMTVIHHKIKKGVVKYPAWLTPDCRHLLSRLLVVNPVERATMAEIMQHPWINKGFHGPPDNYFPVRQPIQLPLDFEIIKGMTGFQFGPSEQIQKRVEQSIKEYAHELESLPQNLIVKTVQAPISYPYLSIYHLAKEKMVRDAAEKKDGIVVNEEDRIEDTLSDIPRVQPLTGNDVNLNRSKSCKPTTNGVSGRYPSITRSTRTPEPVPSTNLSRRNSELRSNVGPSPFRRVSQKEGGADFTRHTSIRFNDNYGTNLSNSGSVRRATSATDNSGNKRLSAPITSNQPVTTHLTVPANPEITNSNQPPPKSPSRKPSRLERLGQMLTRGASTKESKRAFSPSVDISSANANGSVNDAPRSPMSPLDDEPRVTNSIPPVSIKGLFSVSTTSTKKPSVIRDEIIRVLDELGLAWREMDGYISVAQTQAGLVHSGATSETPSTATSPQASRNQPLPTAFNSGSEDSSESHSESESAISTVPRQPPTIEGVLATEGLASPSLIATSVTTDPSISSKPSPGAAFKAKFSIRRLRSPRPQTETVNAPTAVRGDLTNTGPKPAVRFEVSIVRVGLFKIYGIKFRRLVGHSWMYKELCSKVIQRLKL